MRAAAYYIGQLWLVNLLLMLANQPLPGYAFVQTPGRPKTVARIRRFFINGANGDEESSSSSSPPPSSSLSSDEPDLIEYTLNLPTMMTRMATDVYRRVRWGDKVGPAESASLYMNPATQRLVNVTVSWEPDVADIIKALYKFKRNSDGTGAPLLVGVVGLPGSGKSTSCDILTTYLGDRTMVMPMDGYHLSLEQLAQMPDPADIIYRRGAPDTFDPQTLQEDLKKIKFNNDIAKVAIPGFDHAVGDPSPGQHTFLRDQHDIVIVEGIYLMHQDDGWEDVKSMLDFCIYIEADIDICISRLKIRNQCIPGYTKEEIEIRCEAVDRVNAETVLKSSKLAGLSVQSSAISDQSPAIIAAKGGDTGTMDAEECDIITTEEEIEQYVETVQEEVEAIIQEL